MLWTHVSEWLCIVIPSQHTHTHCLCNWHVPPWGVHAQLAEWGGWGSFKIGQTLAGYIFCSSSRDAVSGTWAHAKILKLVPQSAFASENKAGLNFKGTFSSSPLRRFANSSECLAWIYLRGIVLSHIGTHTIHARTIWLWRKQIFSQHTPPSQSSRLFVSATLKSC